MNMPKFVVDDEVELEALLIAKFWQEECVGSALDVASTNFYILNTFYIFQQGFHPLRAFWILISLSVWHRPGGTWSVIRPTRNFFYLFSGVFHISLDFAAAHFEGLRYFIVYSKHRLGHQFLFLLFAPQLLISRAKK